MQTFLAIDTETKSGKPAVLPFRVRRLLELVKSDSNYRLPRFYAGVCGVCFQQTFFTGSNHGKTLRIVPQ